MKVEKAEQTVMPELIQSICVKLEKIEGAFLKAEQSIPGNLNVQYGWNRVSVTYRGLARIALDLADEIKALKLTESEAEEHEDLLTEIMEALDALIGSTLGQIASNPDQPVVVYMLSLMAIQTQIRSTFSTHISLKDAERISKNLANRIHRLETTTEGLYHDAQGIEEKFKKINEAHDAAVDLPTTLHELKNAKNQIADVVKTVTDRNAAAVKAEQQIEGILKNMRLQEEEGKKTLRQLQVHYSIGVSTALAGSFKKRANQLKSYSIIWFSVLCGALWLGGTIGLHEIKPMIAAMIQAGQIDLRTTLSLPLISILGLGAPAWLAWVATKNIGQCFRLSEDYDFKATIASTYEGFRKEAAELDQELAIKLLDSTLTNIGATPVRLIDPKNPGSPLHEAIDSASKNAANLFGMEKEAAGSRKKRSSNAKQADLDE